MFANPKYLLFCRDLHHALLTKNISLHYHRSFLGLTWALVHPLLLLGIYSFIFKILLSHGAPHYACYAFIGIIVWIWFHSSILDCTRSVVDNQNLIFRPEFPVFILPLVVVSERSLNFLLALPVLFFFLVWDSVGLSFWNFFILPLFALLYLFNTSIGLLLAAINTLYRDIQHIVATVFPILMLLTPIFWNAERVPERFQLLVDWNPLAIFISCFRDVLLYHRAPQILHLAILGIGILILLSFSLTVFRRLTPRFYDEL